MKIIIFIIGHLILSTYATADTLEVEYSSFYSHVKKLDDPDTDALRFAFGFQHIAQKRLCHIISANIVTQKQTLPLTVENNDRFTVPTDKILKMAKAQVIIELDDQANRCDMSVQLETLPSFLKTQYSHDELLLLFNQYQAFFDEMGSFLAFMMPSAEGLSFHFDEEVGLPESLQPLMNKEGALALSKTWLMQAKGLELPYKPLRITAIVEK
ncbi:DUF2987 domain-containing protein [Paraglaciecola sp. MB-3u-78]|uniref:DUF2987 domain-containing protein n=1 Tax=Paraglaciecola sp. MB-3u-78 TaxID=2058332 RepID=UPI000C3405A0|nr:DUF2987 domain-containing protein [Paraglaciecola sp. MB-3u-78]PKG99481.1 DUF2987 domain-containing protein [Paraglaciecola sp. MB-3u-78]